MIDKLAMTLLAAGALAVFPAWAADPQQAKEQDRQAAGVQQKEQAKERVYGWQLMTEEERSEYRAKMRAAKTKEEREAIRAEHHEKMKERAKEKGVTLPDEPPARGGGMMGPGGGMMGPGGGMDGGRRGGY